MCVSSSTTKMLRGTVNSTKTLHGEGASRMPQPTVEPNEAIELEKPLLARWAVPGVFIPGSSQTMGSDDDTGTYRADTEEADT